MIKTEQLTKRYDSLTAVDDVSFHVGPGEVLGFLGPNGAGKTTTMRMLAGFVTPTSGRANICGHDVASEPLKAKAALGYLPEGAPLYGEMTVRRFLEFIADLRSLTGARRSQRLGHVIEHLQLGGGLDQNQKHEVRTLINYMARDKIIVISTHILEEVDAVCTRAIIISRGRIVADDTPTGLAARSRYHNAVSMQLEQPAQLAAARAAVAALPAVAEVEVSERDARLTALPRAGAPILPAVSELAVRAGLKLKELHLESGRLDEVFRTITA